MESRGAKSLAFLAQKACIKYLKRIDDVGDCPYDLVRPVLLKLENPEQLHQMEINSPQILGKDREIWLHFIERDIPNWKKYLHDLEDPESWYNFYNALKEQTNQERERAAQKLKAALDMGREEREQGLAKLVPHKNLPGEPTNHKARSLWNYTSGKVGSSKRKPTLMEKMRKEARDARSARIHSPKVASPVVKAPQGLVEQLKREAQAQKAPNVVRTTKPSPAARSPRPPMGARPRPDEPETNDSLRKKEDRLRALTSGQRTTNNPATPSKINVKSPEQSRALPTGSQFSPRPARPRRKVSQNDGGDGDNEDDAEVSLTPIKAPKLKPTATATVTTTPGSAKTRPPQTSVDLSPPPPPPSHPPPRPRFGSPSPLPKAKTKKRKVEASVFMPPKRPKPTNP